MATGPSDDNPLCVSWAQDGECIRNPQFMWVGCPHACQSQTYVDVETDCPSWASNGECEKNVDFMLQMCNASCLAEARKPKNVDMHRNPHLGSEEDGRAHRAATFLPVFLIVAAVLAGVCYAGTLYGGALMGSQEEIEERVALQRVRLRRKLPPRLVGVLDRLSMTRVAVCFICAYYVNEAFTLLQTNPLLANWMPFGSDGLWQQHYFPLVDLSNLVGGGAALLAIYGTPPKVQLWCGALMLGDTLVDSFQIVQRVQYTYLRGRGLYINELMAKKFSLLGCVGLMLATAVQAGRRQATYSGMLLESAVGELSNRLSIALLLTRLLIAVLFLYVGLSELYRLLFEPFTPYLPGDGHDVVWPKAVELILSVPFVLGWRTAVVSRLLAASLLLEALYAWSWWRIPGDDGGFSSHRRAIHYREHFVTNVATAGGLMLLQQIGAGKYTVDELLKKGD